VGEGKRTEVVSGHWAVSFDRESVSTGGKLETSAADGQNQCGNAQPEYSIPEQVTNQCDILCLKLCTRQVLCLLKYCDAAERIKHCSQ